MWEKWLTMIGDELFRDIPTSFACCVLFWTRYPWYSCPHSSNPETGKSRKIPNSDARKPIHRKIVLWGGNLSIILRETRWDGWVGMLVVLGIILSFPCYKNRNALWWRGTFEESWTTKSCTHKIHCQKIPNVGKMADYDRWWWNISFCNMYPSLVILNRILSGVSCDGSSSRQGYSVGVSNRISEKAVVQKPFCGARKNSRLLSWNVSIDLSSDQSIPVLQILSRHVET